MCIHSSNISTVKTMPHIEDQLPTIYDNLLSTLDSHTPSLKDYTPGFMGKTTGPMMVAIGHSKTDPYGVGPDVPGMGFLLWLCCCCGPPCSTPAGAGVGKMKADFNDTVKPTKGVGMHR